MPADVALWSAARVGRSPRRVVALLSARKTVRSGVLWGYIFGLTVASSALGYASTYKTAAQRATMARTFGSNAGLDAITGSARSLNTVAGYTEWKSLAFLSVLGGVWGVLTATRLLRGEEDAGRFELLLAGETTKRGATAQVLAALTVGLGVLFGITAAIMVIVGQQSRVHISASSMLLFSLAVVSSAAMFLAAGALSSQLFATRRQAAGYAGAVLGAAYALRMVADSGTGLVWLRWTSPLGWVEELQPLTGPRPLALLPIGALTVLCGIGALYFAGHRDLGESVLRDRSTARAHDGLLRGPLGLAVRLTRAVVVSWWAAIAATSLLLGYVAKQAGTAFAATPSIERALKKLGASGSGAEAYLGVAFLIVALLVAFIATGQVSAARNEEAIGHLEHLLTRPVSRWRWLAGRWCLAVMVLVASGLLAGLCAWAGAAAEHTGVALGTLLGAGLNLVAPALCLLGFGILAIGAWPRAAVVVTYGVLAWSFLVEIIGGAINVSHWLLDTSVFHQMAPSPAVPENWTVNGVLTGVGIISALVGMAAFRWRDEVAA